MRITDLLKPQSILLGGQAADKAGAIDTLIDLQAAGGHLADKAAYKEAILAREAQSSTAIEAGIAVPHAKSDAVSNPGLAAMTLSQGVDYGAMDKQPSDLFFMIAAPLDGNLHLEILSRLMVLLMDPEFTSGLRAAKTAEEFLAVIDKAEAAKYAIQEEDVLTYAMFPQVAPKFFEKRAEKAAGVDGDHVDYASKSHPV